MKEVSPDPGFWRGRSVLLTGHTGFKGSWALLWLQEMGAHVTGLSLAPEASGSMYEQIAGEQLCRSRIVDLRNAQGVADVVKECSPDIVLHMAAQPIVRRSLADPLETFAVNVMGSANLLNALRQSPALQAILVVTSDKVYANDEEGRAFQEGDRLGGKDPYSASKAATEILASSFARSYFDAMATPLATARCGNIVGGGDYSPDRIVPDVVRACLTNTVLTLRHPEATRPWLHVIDGVAGYLVYAERLAREPEGVPRALNFGPQEDAPITVGEVADAMMRALGTGRGWRFEPVPGSVEMTSLAVDSKRARETLGWRDRICGGDRMGWSADWYKAAAGGADMRRYSLEQIRRYLGAEK